MDLIEQIGAYAGLASVVGLAVLAALYFSQARDVKRLREWAGRAPERGSPVGVRPPTPPPQRVVAQPIPSPAAAVARGAAKPGAEPPGPGPPGQGVPTPTARPADQPTPADPTSPGMVPPPPGATPQPAGAPAQAASTGAAPATASGPPTATPAAARAAEAAEAERPPAAGEAQDEEGREDARPGADGAGTPGGATAGAPTPAGGTTAPGAPTPTAALPGEAGSAAGPDAEGHADEPEVGREDELDEEERFEEEEEGLDEEELHEEVEPEPPTAAPARPPAPGTPGAAPRPGPPTPTPPPPSLTPSTAAAGGPRGSARPSPPARPPQRPILPPYTTSRPGAPASGESSGFPRGAVIAAGAVVFVLAIAALALFQLGGDETEEPRPAASGEREGGSADRPSRGGGVSPGNVTVSVLNGTTVGGLAAKLGDRLEAQGFRLGNVTNSTDQQRAESVVLFAPGAEREAAEVGRRLRVAQREPIDAESQTLAGDATVVVIAGADQTR